MKASAQLNVRIDEKTKSQAMKVLDALNMTMSEAVCLFLRQVVLHRGIPFQIEIPNALTAKTLEESEKGIDLHRVASVDELIEDLEA